MSEQLLNILKLCLLALLYLFFLRVLRAVWVEVKGPPTPRSKRRAQRQPRARRQERHGPRLRVLEPADQRGREFPLGPEITVGRAAGCHITLDDNFTSQIHARIFARDGHFLVEDLGSTNGTYLNRQKVSGPMEISRGDLLQIGNTILELE